jgi:cytochrome P450
MGVQASDLTEGSIGRGVFDAADRGMIPREAAAGIIHLYIAAGLDTTIASIGNAIALLGANPEQYQLLRADPTLIGSTFNEVLRYWSAVHAWGRRVTTDVEIDGVVIPAGAQAAFLFGAGNHDPRHYDNADAFDVTRNPSDHLSFGYGPHSCAGQGLARLEAHAVLAAWCRRVASYTCGPEERVISNSTRSIDRLPVTVVSA